MHQNDLYSQSWLTHLVSAFILKLTWWQVGKGEERDTSQVQCPQEAPGTDLCCVFLGFLMLPLSLWWLTRIMGPQWLRLLVFSFKPSLHPKKSSGLFWSVWEGSIRPFTKLPGTFPLRRQTSSLHPVFSCASNKMSVWHTEHGVSLLFYIFPLHDIFHLT